MVRVTTYALMLLLLSTIAASKEFDDKAFLVTLTYSHGTLATENVTVVNQGAGFNPRHNTGDYELRLLDSRHNVLLSKRFGFPLRMSDVASPDMFDAENNQRYIPESAPIEEAETTFSLPYFSESRTMEVYDLVGARRLVINVGQYQSCNQNGVCEPQNKESAYLCPEDCADTSRRIFLVGGLVVGAGAIILFVVSLSNTRRRR